MHPALVQAMIWLWRLVHLSVIVHSKPDSRMCQPAYDYCLGKDRVGVTGEYWAQRLFRAVSSDDILCMGAFCVNSWLVDASYKGECCQAVQALNTVLRSTPPENLGITESQKLYYYTLMDIYTPDTGVVYHTPEWWHTLSSSPLPTMPETPTSVFWEPGYPIEYPFWTFVRVALGGDESPGAYALVRKELESNWPSLVTHLEQIFSNEPETVIAKLKQVLFMLGRINTVEWTIRGRPYPTNLPAVNIMDMTPVNLTGIASIESGCYHARVCAQWSGRTCLTPHPSMSLTWCP